MGSLLQLLLGIAAQQQEDHSPTRAAAAAAVRVLTSSALHLGWDKLYLGTPLLLQVSQLQPDLGYLPVGFACSKHVFDRMKRHGDPKGWSASKVSVPANMCQRQRCACHAL
jgi:hypothetical protein